MSRSRYRACLQDGLRLDLNRLVRDGFLRPGAVARGSIKWHSSYWGELASATIEASASRERGGWLRIQIEGDTAQIIGLVGDPRRFGGRQWYFVCGRMGRRASVLW